MGVIRELARTARYSLRGQKPIFIDYPPAPGPRYGHGRPPHAELQEMFAKDVGRYSKTIQSFGEYSEKLRQIPVSPGEDPREPFWVNRYIQGLDPISLYALVAKQAPATYLEIGSGNSTKFASKSIRDNGLRTRIISIDPQPRAEIDELCDHMIREPLERTDLRVFEQLANGDILVIDGSHRCLTNSDATIVFLEILPRLPRGVLIYIDDIYLPADYPPLWARRYYSEQYLLAATLLSDNQRYEVVLPSAFVDQTPDLRADVETLWDRCGIADTKARASSNGFWMRVR